MAFNALRKWGRALAAIGATCAGLAASLQGARVTANHASARMQTAGSAGLAEGMAAPPGPGMPHQAALSRFPERVASYTLRARLEPDTHSVHATGTIHWVNTSRVPVRELFFHFYLNAFSHAQTLFNRSPFTRARSGRRASEWGRTDLLRLAARELEGSDLMPALEPHTPGDPLDATDRRLVLPAPVEPGGTLTLDVEFRSVLPSVVERTGFSRDFYFVAQWFPKLARLEPDGTWAHFPFHPHAEFYADFGAYDVTLDVPEDMVVGATGHRESEVVAAGRRVIRQRADPVHDFAWTAWPHFERREERIGDVDVHLLHPPGHQRNVEQTLASLRFALPHFAERYGSYPYPDLTVVHPPEHAASAGGMEYPTLITTGGAWHTSHWSRAVELVTIHELGHQWFYGVLASNEPRWPVLDEGLNSYAESVASRAMFGASSASELGLELSADALRRAAVRLEANDVPLATAASEFVGFRELGALVYSKTALLFETIARVYGEEELKRALRRYADEYRFRHPTPDDLLRVLEATLGVGAAENVAGVLIRGESVNYAVSDITSVRSSEASAAAQFDSRVVVRRHGELEFPVDILLVAADGQTHRERWDGSARIHIISRSGPSPIVTAVVDPERTVWIDDDWLDNARTVEAEYPTATLERSLYWAQLLLGWLGP